MSLFLGNQRVAGHSASVTPEDIGNKAVSFNDDGNISNYSSYDEIDAELSDNSMLNSLIASLKRGGYISKRV